MSEPEPRMKLVVKWLTIDGVTAGACARWIPALQNESLHQAVEQCPVIVSCTQRYIHLRHSNQTQYEMAHPPCKVV